MGVTEIVCALVLGLGFAVCCFVVARISAWITARDEAYEKAYEKDKKIDEKIEKKRKKANQGKSALKRVASAIGNEFTGERGDFLKFESGEAKVKEIRVFMATLLGLAGGFLLGHHFDFGAELVLMMYLFILLFMIGFIDRDTMEIPPYLNYTILILGIAAIWLIPDVTIKERLIGCICISLPLRLINFIIPDAFGGGDIKLMFATGFLLGWKIILVGFIFGIFIGGFIGVVTLLRKKKGGKDHMPFGPSLCLGIGIAVIYGMDIINWYGDILAAQMTH